MKSIRPLCFHLPLMVIFLFCFVQVVVAKKKNPLDPNYFFDKNTTFEVAVKKLDKKYLFLKKDATNRYRRKKEKVGRSLGTLKTSKSQKKRQQKKVTAYYQKELKYLKDNYRKTRKIINRRYQKLERKKPRNVSPSPSKTKTGRSVPLSEVKLTQNLREDLKDLQVQCFEEEKSARQKYRRKKKKADRSLGSLERREEARRSAVNRAQRELTNQVEEIRDDCRHKEARLRKAYRTKSMKEAKALRREREEAEREKKKAKKRVQKENKAREPSSLPMVFKQMGESFRFQGRLRQEVAYRIVDPHQFTKIKTQLIFSESMRATDDLRFKFAQRAYYDAVFSLTDNYPDNVRDDQESEFESREAFLDYSYENKDFRIGQQQTVWGETIGLFIADVVNAKDYREFILPDFEFIRIPQWTAEMSVNNENIQSEFILTLPEFNKFGKDGAEFEFPLPVPTGTAYTIHGPSTPSASINNGEFGARFSALMGGLDLGLFGFHGWDKTPIYFRTVDMNGFHFTPEYKRQDFIGVTFSKDISDSILKGEMVAMPGKYFSTEDPESLDGVDAETAMDSVLGLDHTIFGSWDANIQWVHRWIPGASEFLINEKKSRSHLSFWCKTSYFNGKIEPELFIIGGLSEKDNLIRPKIGWRITDRLQLIIGADIFDGDEISGLFGPFKDRDRTYGDLELYF